MEQCTDVPLHSCMKRAEEDPVKSVAVVCVVSFIFFSSAHGRNHHGRIQQVHEFVGRGRRCVPRGHHEAGQAGALGVPQLEGFPHQLHLQG